MGPRRRASLRTPVASGDGVTRLVADAHAWIEAVHPYAQHLERTLDWVLEFEPDSSEALRIAAVTHDAERAFPDPEANWVSWRDFDREEYNRWHQDRCADFVGDWLRERGADTELVGEVEALVRAHEDGGWPEADLLQAADSVSFLEVMPAVVESWVTEKGAPRSRARLKLQTMCDRINPRLARPRELAADLLEADLASLDRGAPQGRGNVEG
jgi:hypothetical protein